MLVTNIHPVSKKEATRLALIAAALELFARDGYERTTTAAIAAKAGVTEMTLFRHFATKAALVVDDPYDPLIAQAIADRPMAEPPLRAAMRGVLDAWGSVPPPASDDVRERLRIVAATPSLASALVAGSRATEDAIADALQGRGVEPVEARIVAAATVGGLNAALLDWSRGEDPDLGSALRAAAHALGGD
jgi:AcrR family transcriptional regulator